MVYFVFPSDGACAVIYALIKKLGQTWEIPA